MTYAKLICVVVVALGFGACRRETAGFRETEQLRLELQAMNLAETAKMLQPLVDDITAELVVQKVVLSSASPQHFTLVTDTNVLKAYVGQDDPFSDGNTSRWSESERQLAEIWLRKLRKFRVFGFSGFSRTNEVRIYLKPNLYLLYIAPTATAHWREQVDQLVRKGRDPRGDIFFRVATNVIVGTERR